MPYIAAYANEARKREWLPKMVAGEMIGAIAMIEPGMGRDPRPCAPLPCAMLTLG